jgi:UDP-N-acetylmuramate dehydrogenase
MTKLQEKIKSHFPHLNLQFDFMLSKITYFKVGGPAEVFVELKEEQELIDLLSFCRENKIKHLIIGGASNVIVADDAIKGIVIKYINSDISKVIEDDNFSIIEANSGIKMPILVSTTVKWGLTGLELFLGVPGMLGGAIYNNAHYLSDLISEHVYSVKVLDCDGKVIWVSAENCGFRYDHSRFQNSGEIIMAARFKLKHGDPAESQELIKKATEYRAKTQPLGMPSSGCIFQNVPNNDQLKKQFPQFVEKEFVPSGFLIDQAGLKNSKQGNIEVSDKHAAFMVNLGGGTTNDLRKLIHKVKDKVKEKFGVELKEEVFYIE